MELVRPITSSVSKDRTESPATDSGARGPQAPPAWIVLGRLLSGYAVSQLIHAAVRLGLPDLLGEGPKTAEQLATATGVHAPSLFRVLRALAAVGLVTQADEASFRLTPVGECLRARAPGSMRALALTTEESYRAWGEVLYSVRTGAPAFDHVYGTGRFAYLAENSSAAATFDEAMAGLVARAAAAVAATYDFSGLRTLVDVGGGGGALLAAVLNSHPTLRGVLFDRPAVVRNARSIIEAAGVAGRCALEGGDFFEAVPAGGDAYILSHTLHNWDDARALRIIESCRKAMSGEGRLLVVEMVVPPQPDPSPEAYVLAMTDLQMMVMTGGRERSEEEWRALLASGGFNLVRLVPLGAHHYLLEAFPAEARTN